MKRRAWVPVLAPLTLVLAAFGLAPWSPAAAGPEFKTVHQFSLPGPAQEAELASIMAEFNEFFEAEGVDARYRLWRAGEEAGEPVGYLWESTWTTRADYDEAHALPAFRAVLQRHLGTLSRLLGSHEYVRYTEVELEAPSQEVFP